jgi:D-galactarolactone cycloisomerase
VDGYATLRRRTSLRIAAGEMVRGAFEARDLIVRGGVDVIQPDVVLAGGLGGVRRLAGLADLFGRSLSPHTWSNGLGLVANLHLALAVSTCPYVEVPFDPPAWTPERRDGLLPAPLEIAADGTIAPPPGPGLGVTPDLDALEAHRVG